MSINVTKLLLDVTMDLYGCSLQLLEDSGSDSEEEERSGSGSGSDSDNDSDNQQQDQEDRSPTKSPALSESGSGSGSGRQVPMFFTFFKMEGVSVTRSFDSRPRTY